jgi:hypothetical protein
LSGGREYVLYAIDEGSGIELGADDVIRAVCEYGDAPVADEDDGLG